MRTGGEGHVAPGVAGDVEDVGPIEDGSLVAFASAELPLGRAPVDVDREVVVATWVEMVMGMLAAPDVSG